MLKLLWLKTPFARNPGRFILLTIHILNIGFAGWFEVFRTSLNKGFLALVERALEIFWHSYQVSVCKGLRRAEVAAEALAY
jgi:hypothetical protein